jgi:hypothetical protein
MAMYASDAASAITAVQPAGPVLSWHATVNPRPTHLLEHHQAGDRGRPSSRPSPGSSGAGVRVSSVCGAAGQRSCPATAPSALGQATPVVVLTIWPNGRGRNARRTHRSRRSARPSPRRSSCSMPP